jgi:transketolase
MRKQLIKSLQDILYSDNKSVLFLGDIGVFGFRKELENIPNRVYNIGILEQATISAAAGLSKMGMFPFVHTIAPFMVERALEQLKIDKIVPNKIALKFDEELIKKGIRIDDIIN